MIIHNLCHFTFLFGFLKKPSGRWNNLLGIVNLVFKLKFREFSHEKAKTDYNLSSLSVLRVLMVNLELRESRVRQDRKVMVEPLDPKDHPEHLAQW